MREGGSYIVHGPGQEPVLAERTAHHPDGDCARYSDGTPVSGAPTTIDPGAAAARRGRNKLITTTTEDPGNGA